MPASSASCSRAIGAVFALTVMMAWSTLTHAQTKPTEPMHTGADPAGDLGEESLGGLLGFGAGGLAVFLSLGVCWAQADMCTPALVGSLVVLPLVTAAAVTNAGKRTGGTGTFGGAFVGALLGVVAASSGTYLIARNDSSGPLFDLILPMFAITTVGGAIAGYRASADDEDKQVYATLAPTSNSRGGMLLIGGAL